MFVSVEPFGLDAEKRDSEASDGPICHFNLASGEAYRTRAPYDRINVSAISIFMRAKYQDLDMDKRPMDTTKSWKQY